jgi:transcriptional regulator with XRE-family HTH domain
VISSLSWRGRGALAHWARAAFPSRRKGVDSMPSRCKIQTTGTDEQSILAPRHREGRFDMDKAVPSSVSFGNYFKGLRLKTGKTLREFCLEYGFDPGNLSRLERSRLPPPQAREKLERYAKCLGLKVGSGEWYEFFDLAAAEAGRIPEDLRDEEVLLRLPVIFRTLREGSLTEERMDALIDRLRRE